LLLLLLPGKKSKEEQEKAAVEEEALRKITGKAEPASSSLPPAQHSRYTQTTALFNVLHTYVCLHVLTMLTRRCATLVA
jgi:hypothetical protein